MSDGALFKPDKDFTKEADKAIADAEGLAKVFIALLHDPAVAKFRSRATSSPRSTNSLPSKNKLGRYVVLDLVSIIYRDPYIA